MSRVLISASFANPMQSGRATPPQWKLIFQGDHGDYIDPLMGWTGSTNMLAELRLCFDHLEDAVAYVQARGWSYAIEERPSTASLRPKSYAENFASSRVR